jgi:hypothetical protein
MCCDCKKNTVAETNMCVIAILSQSDCKTGKGGIAKKHSMPNKKEGAQKYIARVPIHKFKQKKDVKVATSQDRVFSYCRA